MSVTTTVSPTQANVLEALGNFLEEVLPETVEVITGQGNRTPQPQQPLGVIMTPIRFTRLSTNVDGNADASFLGSISETTLTINEVLTGAVLTGATLFGVGVTPGTIIGNKLSPSSFQVTPSQVVSQGLLGCGGKTLTQSAELVVQLNFLSLDTASSTITAADLAQTVSTAFRDEFCTAYFEALTPPLNSISPLYADDPRQTPFVGEDNQYQWEWMIEAHLQVLQTIVVPQQYADSATITVRSVEAEFPPAP